MGKVECSKYDHMILLHVPIPVGLLGPIRKQYLNPILIHIALTSENMSEEQILN